MLVFIRYRSLTSRHPQGKTLIFYPSSFFYFCLLIWDTWRGFLRVYLSLERSYSLLHSYIPLLLMLLVSFAPSLSLFLWVTWDKNLQWSWGKRSVWRDRLQQRDTDIWRGFLMESKAGREGGVGTQCFCKCWFLGQKNTKYNLLGGSFSKLCSRYTGGVDSIQTRQYLFDWKCQFKHQTCLKSL